MCKRTDCYFHHLEGCKIGKKSGFICSTHIKEIEGIIKTKDYYDIVNLRNSNNFSMKVSILTLFISFCVLLTYILNILIGKT